MRHVIFAPPSPKKGLTFCAKRLSPYFSHTRKEYFHPCAIVAQFRMIHTASYIRELSWQESTILVQDGSSLWHSINHSALLHSAQWWKCSLPSHSYGGNLFAQKANLFFPIYTSQQNIYEDLLTERGIWATNLWCCFDGWTSQGNITELLVDPTPTPKRNFHTHI